jgi:RNA polymerase sigma-70 factor (ECF subfamily)
MRRVLASQDPLDDPEPLIRRVYSYVAYRIGDGPEAEDITSETFARALRYRDTYDPARGSPVTWLIGIARRCVRDAAAQPRPAPDPPDNAGPGDMAADADERMAVQAAVSRLGDRDRELIALHYGADLTARQIAQRLELSTTAVEVGLHRARRRLRAIMEGGARDVHEPSHDERHVRNVVPLPVREARRPNEGTITDAILEPRRRPRP